MGKRELLIICGFVVVAAIAYQLTAPPAKPGQRGFSISNMFSGLKREISSNAASAKITKTAAIPLPSSVSELRVSTPRSVPLTVIGEAREDIAYEMPVDSTGPDEATAKDWANKVELRKDDLGPAMALNLYFPEEGTQNATVTMKVPARLAVRVENSGKIQVSGVRSVEMRNPAGEVDISSAGAVTGSHRSGDLTINGAATVNVTLSSSRAKIRNVTQDVTLTARNGECWIAESTGPIAVNVTNVELVINAFKNSIKVTGEGGEAKVLDPRGRLSVDGRRMRVQIEATPGADDELTIITTEEPVRLALGADSGAAVDAISIGGKVSAADFGLTPVTEGRESRLTSSIGKPLAHLVVRNSRGDIVISKRK